MRRPALLAALLAGLACGDVAAAQGFEGHGFRIELLPGAPAAAAAARADDADALPDGGVARGQGRLAAAWLIDPTDRYGHGVLGDAIEAGGLRAELDDGRRLTFRLPADSVFEDLTPRLADLDGDGADEIIVVRSYLDRGAALAVLRPAGDGLSIAWEAPAIGIANRWLNPVGVGDFDGDGRADLAYIETPHIGGILRVWTLRGGALVETGRLRGVSNHAIGSRALGLSAVLDVDGDGRDELLLPEDGRRSLALVGWRDGRPILLARHALGAPVVGDFRIGDLDGNGRADVEVPLAGDRRVRLLR